MPTKKLFALIIAMATLSFVAVPRAEAESEKRTFLPADGTTIQHQSSDGAQNTVISANAKSGEFVITGVNPPGSDYTWGNAGWVFDLGDMTFPVDPSMGGTWIDVEVAWHTAAAALYEATNLLSFQLGGCWEARGPLATVVGDVAERFSCFVPAGSSPRWLTVTFTAGSNHRGSPFLFPGQLELVELTW